jgi:hypothetical protein
MIAFDHATKRFETILRERGHPYIAFGCGVREGQRQALLSPALSTMKAGVGGGRHLKTEQRCGAEVSQADSEEVRPTAEDRHRQALGLLPGDERNWRRRFGTRSVTAQQSGGQFSSHEPFRRRERRCSPFGVRRRCRTLAQFMARCATNSIRSAISSRGKSKKQRHSDALAEWRALPSRPLEVPHSIPPCVVVSRA